VPSLLVYSEHALVPPLGALERRVQVGTVRADGHGFVPRLFGWDGGCLARNGWLGTCAPVVAGTGSWLY
jgi:hypothetical protein